MRCREPNWIGSKSGMTRVDVLFTVLGIGVLVLLAWAGVAVAGEPRRIWLCKHHLRTLSDAFAQYAHDNGGAIPPAALEDGTNSITWDAEIAPYLVSTSARKDMAGDPQKLHERVAGWFGCPSDSEPRGGHGKRSYSMPIYDVSTLGWPPNEKSAGGLGLVLDAKTFKKTHQLDSMESAKIPNIKIAMVSAPADTALLVERISILNALWATKLAYTKSSHEQFEAKTFQAKKFHRGKMNYLMLDGHVELLTSAQSAGLIGGVWTIRQAD